MPGLFLALGYTALLLYLMRRMRFYRTAPGLPFRWVAGLFLLKIAAGAVLWAIYTWVYPERVHADVFKFFDDSAVLYGALWERPGDFLRILFGVGNEGPYYVERYYDVMNNWLREYDDGLYNDAHTMIRASAVLRVLSFGWFPVHVVFAAFAGLTGLLALHRTFAGLLPGRERAVAAAFLLVLPSVLLWTSAPLKECLLFLGLGLVAWLLRMLVEHGAALAGLGLLLVGLLLLLHLKFYVLLCMVPALGVLAAGRFTGRPILAAVGVYALCAGVVLAIGALWPQWDVLEIIARKHRDFIGHGMGTQAGSFVMPPPLRPTVISCLKQVPYALYMALLGPVVHPSGGLLGLLAVLENVLVLVVPVVCLLHRRPWHTVDGSLLAALLGYCFSLLLIIGLTTPVMGALVRYRAPVLPFLLIAALLVLDQDRLLTRWPRLRAFLAS